MDIGLKTHAVTRILALTAPAAIACTNGMLIFYGAGGFLLLMSAAVEPGSSSSPGMWTMANAV